MQRNLKQDQPIFDRFRAVPPKPVTKNDKDNLNLQAEELRKAWKQDAPNRSK